MRETSQTIYSWRKIVCFGVFLPQSPNTHASLLPNRLGGGDAKVTLTVVRQIYAAGRHVEMSSGRCS